MLIKNLIWSKSIINLKLYNKTLLNIFDNANYNLTIMNDLRKPALTKW